jgi:hypothetical protein
LQSRYDGSYEIKEKLSAVLYLAEIEGELVKFHAVIAVREEHFEDYLKRRSKKYSTKMKGSNDSKSIDTWIGGTTGKNSSLSPKNLESESSRVEVDQVTGDSNLKNLKNLILNEDIQKVSKSATWQHEKELTESSNETKDELECNEAKDELECEN